MPFSDAAQEEALRARLREITRRYPQAELARRLGMRRSTVNRYLQGNRIPAAFLAGIAREFGVNTAWLMLGEGVPWIADVRADQASVGKGLLELVQAMERVSRLRLGALAGKTEAAALRELSDAMQSHERISARLAEKSRDTYRKILDDWLAAVKAGDKELSNQMARAAEQVARLCPDPILRRGHESMLAAHKQLCGRNEDSLVHRKNVFAASVGESGKLDAKGVSAAVGLAVTLDALSRTREARAVLKAALSLGHDQRDTVIYAQASAFLGWTDLELGFIARGMKRLHAAMARAAQGEGSENLRMSIAYGSYLSGSCELDGMVVLCPLPLLGRLRGLAPWCLQQKRLETLARQCEPMQDRNTPEARILGSHLAAVQGRHSRALSIWHEAEQDSRSHHGAPLGTEFTMHAMRAHLLLLAGRKPQAREALLDTEDVRRKVPAEIALDCHWLRLHWRNAAQLCKQGESLWRKAARFHQQAAKRGLQAHAPG